MASCYGENLAWSIPGPADSNNLPEEDNNYYFARGSNNTFDTASSLHVKKSDHAQLPHGGIEIVANDDDEPEQQSEVETRATKRRKLEETHKAAEGKNYCNGNHSKSLDYNFGYPEFRDDRKALEKSRFQPPWGVSRSGEQSVRRILEYAGIDTSHIPRMEEEDNYDLSRVLPFHDIDDRRPTPCSVSAHVDMWREFVWQHKDNFDKNELILIPGFGWLHTHTGEFAVGLCRNSLAGWLPPGHLGPIKHQKVAIDISHLIYPDYLPFRGSAQHAAHKHYVNAFLDVGWNINLTQQAESDGMAACSDSKIFSLARLLQSTIALWVLIPKNADWEGLRFSSSK